MKKIYKIIIILALLIMPVQVSATPIIMPVPIHVRRPSAAEIKYSAERDLKINSGIYKLGQQPLILGISKEDYPKLEELFSGTRLWKWDAIFSDTLDAAKRSGNIVVYDKKNETVYEVPEEKLKSFLAENNLENNSKNQNDIVEIWETEKTQVVNLKQVKVGHKDTRPTLLDVPEYKIEEIKLKIKDFESLREKSFKEPKYRIKIDDESNYITKSELKKILNVIDTQQSRTAMEDIDERVDLLKQENYFAFAMMAMVIALIIILLFGSFM